MYHYYCRPINREYDCDRKCGGKCESYQLTSIGVLGRGCLEIGVNKMSRRATGDKFLRLKSDYNLVSSNIILHLCIGKALSV